MKIFTDESGDFSLTNTINPSLVASLICTEDIYEGIKRFMYSFEERNSDGKETKGSHLTYEQRLKVCRFIKKNRTEMKIGLTIVSPKMVSQDNLIDYRALQSETFERNKQWYLNHGGKHFLSHYDKLIKIALYQTRMSDEEFLQALLLVQQLHRVLTFFMVYFYEPKYRRCFKEFQFVFDRKLPGKLAGMEKYFQTYVMPFLDAQSKLGDKIPIVDVWKKGHPFIDRYMLELKDGKRGIYLNKIFGDNCTFMDSKDEPGLRLVDIISNTVYNYLVNPDNPQYDKCYHLLQSAMGGKNNQPLFHIMLRNKEDYKYREPD
ncbi:DUF3800 domain-containing protein [Paenibacillus sp. sptzw28]|uniref:DUF3800 domain-containing protein n=1 Tax=Paenibacillus sp. sptzw28 TaxID=715179 RepID=UPI001C6E5CAF|nr:DUF3800 domain-containing protein [Paenibacillus sp. sptzw28]QYR19790.1 DUF3800 domain-containing protein [Paenibacillus sp. sptzw28]